MSRVVFLVLDSVGLTASKDADKFGDVGASTIGSLYRHRVSQGSTLRTPNLNNFGLDDLLHRHGISKNLPQNSHDGCWGTLEEISAGKDTSSGHWEFAGIPQVKAFPIFPNGFPVSLLDTWVKQNNLPGYLGNCVASGTTIIHDLGEEHISTGKPIVYTSSDSVFQIAVNEETFGLQRLHKICESARELLNDLNVGRVIARPFTGKDKNSFVRTENRKDYSVMPDYPNLLDILSSSGYFVYGVGKIDDIFCHRGLTHTNHTGRNETSFEATLQALKETENQSGLIFVNLIDFDQKYGHRRDVEGYTKCLEEFDDWLATLKASLQPSDTLIISADHGNDPSFKGTDHTREIVPFFIYKKDQTFKPKYLGHFTGFQHMSRWILKELNAPQACFNQLTSLKNTESVEL